MKKALVTGITGQDGIYLAKLLLKKDYEVHGLVRNRSSYDSKVLKKMDKSIYNKINFHKGDLGEQINIKKLIKDCKPDEIYNLGAISSVQISERYVARAYDVNFLGVVRILEAIKNIRPNTKLFQAGSLMQFSDCSKKILTERSEFIPSNVYGKSKQLAYEAIIEYRKKYKLFICCGFLSNHESCFRSYNSLSRIIVRNVVRYSQGKIKNFTLYNLDYQRDWGHAKDFVYAMWLMLQNRKPEDFIISSNYLNSVKYFCELAFKEVGVYIKWINHGGNYYAINTVDKSIIVRGHNRNTSNKFFGSSRKINKKLNWFPTIDTPKLVKEMIADEIISSRC